MAKNVNLKTNKSLVRDFCPQTLDIAVIVYILRAILLNNTILSLEHKTGHPMSLQRSNLGIHFTLKPV